MDEQGNDNGIYVMNRTIRMNIIPRSQHAMTLCVICLLTVCAFLPTFWNGFQKEWDDQWMVMNPLTVSPSELESACGDIHDQKSWPVDSCQSDALHPTVQFP